MTWTIDFLKRWHRHMTLKSAWQFRNLELRRTSGQLRADHRVRLHWTHPIATSLEIREDHSDYWIMQEILVAEVYSGLEQIGRCQTIIDLGANIGCATLYLAATFPEARIFSVEPQQSNYAVLKDNVAALRVAGRSATIQAAVWGENCRVEVENPDAPNWGFVVGPKTEGAIEGLSMVQLLDRSGFEYVDLLKVDVEGAEVELFRGPLDWLPRVRAIAIEFHGDSRIASRFDEIMTGRVITGLNDHTVLAVRR